MAGNELKRRNGGEHEIIISLVWRGRQGDVGEYQADPGHGFNRDGGI